ncbi:hypothetical protein BJ742DRAFT_577060 [Cladochytrium replicatum]|nr:hypothetical protein BJ742DRAFT_577060 [Cladochytrium replicatum]
MATTNALQPDDCRFLGGVGWCVKNSDGRYSLFFMDGVQLNVEARLQTVVWVSQKENPMDVEAERRFKIDKALPEYAKEKLAHLPRSSSFSPCRKLNRKGFLSHVAPGYFHVLFSHYLNFPSWFSPLDAAGTDVCAFDISWSIISLHISCSQTRRF